MSVKPICPHCNSENYDCSRVTRSKGRTKEIWGCKDCYKATTIDCTPKYDQLTLSIAEEMASNDKDTAYAYSMLQRKGKVSDYYTKWWLLSVGEKMEDAYVAVKRMAVVAKDGGEAAAGFVYRLPRG